MVKHGNFEPTKNQKNKSFHWIWMIPIDSVMKNRRGIRFLRSWGPKNSQIPQTLEKTSNFPKNKKMNRICLPPGLVDLFKYKPIRPPLICSVLKQQQHANACWYSGDCNV